MKFDDQIRECHPSTWLRTSFDRREKSLNTVSCKQRSEGFTPPAGVEMTYQVVTDFEHQKRLG
jgi:hypothetical protein